MMPLLLLSLPVLAFLLLLFGPAILEWKHPKDDASLPVDPSYFGNDTHFPERFRQIASSWWGAPGKAQREENACFPTGAQLYMPILAEELHAGAKGSFAQEVWTRRSADFGPECAVRAVLAEENLHLSDECTVERWVHAEQSIQADLRVDLGHRATSSQSITLAPGCKGRLFASETVRWNSPIQALPTGEPPAGKLWKAQDPAIQQGGTIFLDGDFILEAGTQLDSPLVVRGNLYIRPGAILSGDIKAHGDVIVEQAVIRGHLASEKNVYLGNGSRIGGCVLGHDLVWLGHNVCLGSPHARTAVVGDRIHLTGSGQLHGRIKSLTGQIEVSE